MRYISKWTFLQSACQLHAPSKHETFVAFCCQTKLHILECPFIVPSTRCTCVMIMLINQLVDMPHLAGGWIILAKEKCSLTGMYTIFCRFFEQSAFCAYGTFLRSFISAHEIWHQHFTCFYIFVRCNNSAFTFVFI